MGSMYVFTHHIVYDYDIHLYTIVGVLSQNMTMDFKFSNHYVKIIMTLKDFNSPGAREPRLRDLYSKNFKNLQNIFVLSIGPP